MDFEDGDTVALGPFMAIVASDTDEASRTVGIRFENAAWVIGDGVYYVPKSVVRLVRRLGES